MNGSQTEGYALEGERLDVAVSRIIGRSRSFAEKLVRAGLVAVGGIVDRKHGRKLNGERVTVNVPEPATLDITPEDIDINIVYDDAHIAIVDKPAGLVVHPANGHESGTLVNALMAKLSGLSGIGGAIRAGVVHRLDKDTSGLIIIAKRDDSHTRLVEMFKKREIEKTYIAIVEGRLKDATGEIVAPIGRSKTDRKRMAVVDGGKHAHTSYRVAEEFRAATLLEVALHTGRTHQIRVHMRHIGHPIVGDVIYGRGETTAPRLMLHAARLRFNHPITGDGIDVEAALPDEMEEFIRGLRVA